MSSPEQPTLGEWLGEGPFKLSMSAGFFAFVVHAGVVEALHERELEPDAFQGSSAGGFVAVLRAAGVEPGKIAEELTNLRREDFWDPHPGFGLLRGKLMDEKLREILPVAEFDQCDVPSQVSVFDLLSREAEVIDEGDLATAIRASCAFPFLLHPVMIDGRPKFDGGIKDWSGLSGAASEERILYHHIAPRQSKIYTVKPPNPTLTHSNLKTLEIEGLPQVTPFALHRGVEAYNLAKGRTLEALDQPVG
jgi:NTE family protein